MGLYRIDNKKYQATDVPRADDRTSYIEKEIKKLNTDLKALEKKRTKIVNDFGESYSSDIDERIRQVKGDIETKTQDAMISQQIDALLKSIIQTLNVTYRYGLLSTDNNDKIRPFRPSADYSIYEFNSGSGGRLAIVQNGFRGFWSSGDVIRVEIRYVFSNCTDITVMRLEWSTKKDGPHITDNRDFDDSVMVNINEYDEYQVAEFHHAVDKASQSVAEWYPTYVSVEDAKANEEKQKMEQRMAYTAAILTDTCVDSVEE